MKKILGSLLILLSVALYGADEEYFFKATLSKAKLLVGERAVLDVSFHKHRDINTVLGRFKPVSGHGVRYEDLKLESESIGAYDIEHFIFLVTFKKAGRFTLPVTAEIQKFNEEDIIESNNHRDAMGTVAASTHPVNVTTFSLDVTAASAPLPVGEFKMTASPDETSVLKNEPAHFSVTIEGEGDVNALHFPKVDIPGAKLFVQEGERSRWLKDGRLFGRMSNQYAVVAGKDFSIPSLTLAYISSKNGALKRSISDEIAVAVRSDPAFAKERLLDADDTVPAEPFVTRDGLLKWGIYGLLFAAGYLAAKVRIRVPRRRRLSGWIRRISQAGDQKTLLKLLLPRVDHPVCRGYIIKLESGPLSAAELAELKRTLVRELQSEKQSVG